MSEQERSEFLLDQLRAMRRDFARKLATQPGTETEAPASPPALHAESAGSAEPREGWVPLGNGQFARGRVAEWLAQGQRDAEAAEAPQLPSAGETAPDSADPDEENPFAQLT